MSISIETPDGPVVVDLTQDEYRRASSIWDPRARPSPLGGAGDEQEDIESNGDPVGNIIGSCIELCLDRIADLRESDAAMDGHDELENWELELNTWKLCEFLFPQRLALNQDIRIESEANIYASDAKLAGDLMADSPELTEANLVRRWLEETTPEFAAVEVRKGYYPHTSKALRDKHRSKNEQGGVLVKELDPDSQLRTKRVLDIGDQDYEDQLCKTLYAYVRRGKAEDAIHLCEQSDQAWRAASLMGALLHGDDILDDEADPEDALDGSGNMNRDLWKACAYRIACEESFSLHERALYAALCGDLRNALPVCQTWEDFIWTYYAVMLESRTAEHLAAVRHVDALEPEELMPDGSPFEEPAPQAFSSEDIFRKVEAMPSDGMRQAIRNPFHRMQKMIILDKMDQLVHDVRSELELDANSQDVSHATLFKLPHFLRVLTHLIILHRAAGFGGMAQDDANYIIKTYVDMFMATNAQPPSVLAPYVAELPRHDQILCFASLFSRIKTTARQKAEFLDLVEAYNMDRFSIAAKTVELVINGDALGGTNDVEEKDWRQIDSIGWLTQDKGLFIQAAFRSHQIARRFLIRRRLASARLLLDSIPEDLIAPQLMRDISESADVRAEYQAVGNVEQRLQVDLAMEGLFLRQLVTALEDYQNWRETMARKPIPGFEEGRETRSLRRNEQAARQRDKAAWESEARALTVRAAQELDALLNIGFFVDKGWSMSLQGIENFDIVLNERAMLRDTYVPEVVSSLHAIYFETRDLFPENLGKAVALVNKVGDHSSGIFETFVRTNTISNFLQVARKSCLELVRKGESPFPPPEAPLLDRV